MPGARPARSHASTRLLKKLAPPHWVSLCRGTGAQRGQGIHTQMLPPPTAFPPCLGPARSTGPGGGGAWDGQ